MLFAQRPEPRAETEDLRQLITLCPAGPTREIAVGLARSFVEAARAHQADRPYLDAFLQEFGLSNQEGIALMCLAEGGPALEVLRRYLGADDELLLCTMARHPAERFTYAFDLKRETQGGPWVTD